MHRPNWISLFIYFTFLLLENMLLWEHGAQIFVIYFRSFPCCGLNVSFKIHMVALRFQSNKIERFGLWGGIQVSGLVPRPGLTLFKEFDGPSLPIDLVFSVAFCSSTGCRFKDAILKVARPPSRHPVSISTFSFDSTESQIFHLGFFWDKVLLLAQACLEFTM